MDTLTHTLTGGVIAKAIDDEKIGNWGTIAGLGMGFFPDADFVLGLFNRQFYLQYHRDLTHSLILIPFYALFFSWIFVKISKRPHFWSFYKICLAALVSHVFLDLFTSYGTMIFSPFFKDRYFLDLVFIIDLIFSGILFFPWLISIFWRRRVPWVCRGSLIALCLYVLFCWTQHRRAIDLTETFSRNLKEEIVEIASLPQPVSPFRWSNYIETKGRIYQGFVDLLMKEAGAPVQDRSQPVSGSSLFKRLKYLYQPPESMVYELWQKHPDSPWVEKALNTKGVKFYYWFARFPVVRSVNSRNGTHRVEFMDVRFYLSEIRLPFVYYVEFDESGEIRSEGFSENRKKSAE